MRSSRYGSKPAILGGRPLSDQPLLVVKPSLPSFEQIADPVRDILERGYLTNNGPYVRAFERSLEAYFQIPFAQAVANATLGLEIALASLKLEGEVILPAFTYAATPNAVHSAGLKPVFADILPDTFTLDPAAVEAAVTPRTSAILPVHIYGHPCEVEALESLARRSGLALLYDAAHATGSLYRGQPVGGFGDAEVFSFHATKIFPVGEGGCITTHSGLLSEMIALRRKFGDPGNENMVLPGTNAKMQEFNAILGLAALKVIGQHITNRRRYAAGLVERLGCLPGICFQAIRPQASVNYQNFALLIDAQGFGLERDELYEALKAENIYPRKYFYPPMHWHDAYRAYRSNWLPVTERVSSQVICLPFYSEMSEEVIDILCAAIERIHAFAPRIHQKQARQVELKSSLSTPVQWALNS